MKNRLIYFFDKLIEYTKYTIDLKSELKDKYRLKSIINTRNIIEQYKKPIKSYLQFKNIKGIGKGSLDRIQEIIETNNLHELLNYNTDVKYFEYLNELNKIFGLGRKKAYELYNKYNIRSIDDLINNIDKLNISKQIKIGVKYYNKLSKNIDRSILIYVDNLFAKYVKKTNINLCGIMCGSFRRKMKTSNDIDYIIYSPNIINKKDLLMNENLLKKFVIKLHEHNIIIDSLVDINNMITKYMGFCSIKDHIIRIDIRYIPFESIYYAILYFTGSKDFNIKIRNLANSLGYKLNEYGLYNKNNNKFIHANTEKNIFDILMLDYIPPELR
jgi:DNA polymerase/3'-5' exonuclease PolX